MNAATAAAERRFSAAEIAAARSEAKVGGRPLLQVLEEQAGLPARDFLIALAATFRYLWVDIKALHRLQPQWDLLPFTKALQRECLAMRDGEGVLRLVFADPFDAGLLAWAETALGQPFVCCLAHRADLAVYLARHEETQSAMDVLLPEGAAADAHGEAAEDLSLKAISEDSSQVVRLVHSIVYDGLKAGASDVHLESDAHGLAIKYRIDGVLNAVGSMAGHDLAEQVISRIKVMSELDIAERRVPQDGRFKVAMRGREVDFRVSIMPSIFGEDAVLRILDRRALAENMQGLSLERLGFDADSVAAFRRLIHEPYGMVLVTGPTGSGKTTTLYGAVSEINLGQDKFITIEDPVEYQLSGVLQIQVNEKKGLTFARGLRSILRHDPDKILVGEIRDAETAQIAIQAALTGHLVFTTVHANNVFDVIGRFMHIGVDPYSFVSALNGIMAQRLVRVNCVHCAREDRPSPELILASGLTLEQAEEFDFRTGRGCGQCRGTGFKGRKAVAEMLHLNDEIRELIIAREPIRRIKEAARRQGTRYLRETALDLVRRGESTLAEINRVTFVA